MDSAKYKIGHINMILWLKIFKIKIVCFSMGKPKSKSKAQKSKCSGKEKGQFQNLKFLK